MTQDDRPSDDLAIPEAPLSVAVITGFLGSGKTTLLRHLLRHPAMGETAVIVNEFGEIGLDHVLMESAKEDLVLMDSGCLCCTIRGDLVNTIRDLYKRRVQREVPAFERLVIETTGLADPAPILHTLMSDPLVVERFRLDSVITTVDGLAGAASLERHEESRRQAAVADRLLITKTDLAEAEALDDLEASLVALNPAASRQRIVQGAVEPDALFNAGLYDPRSKSADVRRWLKAEAYGGGHEHEHHDHAGPHHDVNRHDASIRAFCLTHDRPLDWDRFCSWIDMMVSLYGRDILRIKGLLNVAGQDRPVVIHGVQHVFHPPVELEAWPDRDRRSQLVFIVKDLSPKLFEDTLAAFNAPDTPVPDTPSSR
ncbi:MAG: GTP-binding protein [Kiloniellales bacterium]|nr:GTP-binding protein [Kiloniellales bacterium]